MPVPPPPSLPPPFNSTPLVGYICTLEKDVNVHFTLPHHGESPPVPTPYATVSEKLAKNKYICHYLG